MGKRGGDRPYSTADKANVRELMIAYAAEYCRGRVNNALKRSINKGRKRPVSAPNESFSAGFMWGTSKARKTLCRYAFEFNRCEFSPIRDGLEKLRHFL